MKIKYTLEVEPPTRSYEDKYMATITHNKTGQQIVGYGGTLRGAVVNVVRCLEPLPKE